MCAFRNTAETWGAVARFFHWTIALLIVGLLVIGFIMGDMENGPEKFQMYMMHKSFGLLALALVVCRVVWRFTSTIPAPVAGTPRWQLLAAEAVHWALYALMLALPITGYLAHSFRGNPLPWFGVESLPVPSLTVQDKDMSHDFGELHEGLVTVLLIVLAAHVGAALFHHFIKKDAVLARMTPFISIPKKD